MSAAPPVATAATAARHWRRPPFIAHAGLRRGLLAGGLAYLVLAIASLELNWERLVLGLERGWAFVAGFLTLTFATIGFMAKLLAEDIEEIEASQLEALRATGAGYLQVLDFAVLSQVTPRLVGLSLYRLDINFRESAVIGIVGAGGIGATLNTAMDRYEFDSAAAVLLVIIAIVMATEYVSGWLRRRIQ